MVLGVTDEGIYTDISMTPAEWIGSHNFAGVTPQTITALHSPSHVTNGVQIDDVLQLFASLELASLL